MRTVLLIPAIAATALLAGCELTPREQCEAPHRSELRVVREEIRATEAALSRGYRLVPARDDWGLHYCLDDFDNAWLCRADEGQPMYDKQRISRAAENAKLNALIEERARLQWELNQCAAAYPGQ